MDPTAILRRIIDDLPQRRDWLDPDLEKAARALLKPRAIAEPEVEGGVPAEVQAMTESPGLYCLGDGTACVPVLSSCGRLFAMKTDGELTLHGFIIGTKIKGPYWSGEMR